MQEESINRLILWVMLILVIILVLWNFSLSINSNKINEKIEVIDGMNQRINDIQNFLAFFWLEKYNLTEYNWLDKYNCTEYREILPSNRQLNVIADRYINTKIIIGDDIYSVTYWYDKYMICDFKGVEIDCKEIFCV